MKTKMPLLFMALLVGMASIPTNDDPMSLAAMQFKQSLTAKQQSKLCFPYLSDERANWQVLPNGVAGVRLEALQKESREALDELLATVLSTKGLETIDTVRLLESILAERETAAGRPSSFHGAERYFVTLYGDPEGRKAWGWRFEGHHLSLNVTHKNDSWTSVAPFYVGSQPAHVQEGEHAGLRLMGAEDDLARSLYTSLNTEQQEQATLSGSQPSNVIMLPRRKTIDDRGGISWSKLNKKQRQILTSILDLWLTRRTEDLATVRNKRLRASQLDQLSFGWIGSPESDAGHYWRIFGAGLTIEHSAPASDPDHVHTLWRDERGDLGQGQE
ncbi:MAG TPA: DUF3500 domain-containing protein [Planctomycetes bacterium]|nr:DUF3500 domain-containing protein [Planctomycetota bacterium]HIL36010.1 DUF3500 domain-containing protein [Planctomycetota bacterium]